ncbi:LysR family transcriptional regulator [Streptacidiphilus sp. EB129]|uniref:LysR family transcriptional regulator n=1 Tax=Streptacidiphilus sp. EB129 TaxID=3156262 RepID=UPI003515917C
MDARQLEYFLAVVEHGGFTRAADALHITQPALSQAVRALERDLGAQLFERAGRGVVLSAAGTALVGPARTVVLDLQSARTAVESVVGLVAGRVDLVVQPAAVDLAAQLTSRFRLRHPRVTVRLAEPRRSPYLGRDLRDGDAQLGLSYLPLWEGDGLEVEPLRSVEFAAVFPPGSEPGPDPLPVGALAEVPLIAGSPGTAWRELVDRVFADAGITPLIAVETTFRDSIATVVTSGGAAGIVPQSLAGDIARLGGVVRRLEPPVRRGFGIVHRPGPLPPAAAAFLATARAWAEE